MNWKQVQCEIVAYTTMLVVVVGWGCVVAVVAYSIGFGFGGGTIDGTKEAQRGALIAKVHRLEAQAKQP